MREGKVELESSGNRGHEDPPPPDREQFDPDGTTTIGGWHVHPRINKFYFTAEQIEALKALKRTSGKR